MTINPGMLLFCILDSCLAFFLVFFVSRSQLGGEEKALARIVATILATLVFIIYFSVLIWFNTTRYTIPDAGQKVVYAAPIVLSVLMTILTLLSQPPKKKEPEEEEEEEGEGDAEEAPEQETSEETE